MVTIGCKLIDLPKKKPHIKPLIFYSNVETQSVKTPAGVKTYKQVIKHVYDKGHQIASHTYSHKELGGLSTAEVKSEMTKLDKIFKSVIGKSPLYMRPPSGSYDDNTLAALGSLGYKVILWDIDSNDWRYKDISSLSNEQANYKSVIDKDSKKNPHGHIALQHDVHKKTVTKLVPWVISMSRVRRTTSLSLLLNVLVNPRPVLTRLANKFFYRSIIDQHRLFSLRFFCFHNIVLLYYCHLRSASQNKFLHKNLKMSNA